MRLAFFGRMGTGKTTAAKYLVENHGFQRVSLASPVKAVGAIRDELPEELWRDALILWAGKLLPDPIYDKVVNGWYHGMKPRQYLAELWYQDLKFSKDRREMYQRIGTDSGRRINPYIWINWFARHLPDGNLVVDDVRFRNEMNALRDLSFKVIEMRLPQEVRVVRLVERDGFFDPTTQGHASETELEGITGDAVIHNDQETPESLGYLLDEIVTAPGVHVGS